MSLSYSLKDGQFCHVLTIITNCKLANSEEYIQICVYTDTCFVSEKYKYSAVFW